MGPGHAMLCDAMPSVHLNPHHHPPSFIRLEEERQEKAPLTSSGANRRFLAQIHLSSAARRVDRSSRRRRRRSRGSQGPFLEPSSSLARSEVRCSMATPKSIFCQGFYGRKLHVIFLTYHSIYWERANQLTHSRREWKEEALGKRERER